MKSYLLAIVLTIAVCGLSCKQQIVPPPAPSWLPEGETLELLFASHGCFHYESCHLVFRSSPEYTVSLVDICDVEESYISSEVELSRIALTPADLEKIGNLLCHYQSVIGGGCTTTEWVTLIRRRHGKVVTVERYTDHSCATYWMDDVLTVNELLGRLNGNNWGSDIPSFVSR